MAKLIKENQINTVLRYVKLVIQEQLANVLNYNFEIKNDKNLLEGLIKIKDSTDYLDAYFKNNTTL